MARSLAGGETGLPGAVELNSEMASNAIAILFMPSQTEGRAKCSRPFPGPAMLSVRIVTFREDFYKETRTQRKAFLVSWLPYEVVFGCGA
jgi:hypothetical protein